MDLDIYISVTTTVGLYVCFITFPTHVSSLQSLFTDLLLLGLYSKRENQK